MVKGQVVQGTFNPKRGLELLTPEAKETIGKQGSFRAAWIIKSEVKEWNGTFAMCPATSASRSTFPFNWVPQEDIDVQS